MIPAPSSQARATRPRRTLVAIALGCTLVLASCSLRERLDGLSLTYKINIQQGVVVTQEMADQLKPGMSRDQVKFVLGTPILTDPFHADRWDYPFRFQPGRGPVEERHFTVFFDQNALARFESDKLPTEEEFAASRNFATTRLAKAPPLAPSPIPQKTTSTDIGNAPNGVNPNVNITIRRPQTAVTPDSGTSTSTTGLPPTPATDADPTTR